MGVVTDVVNSYQRMSAADRVELMCRLFDGSLPCEVRFMCSVLHDIASRDHESLQKLENNVNRVDSYKHHQKDLSNGLGHLCHSLALINPDNRAVANSIYSQLNSSDVLNSAPSDPVILDEYRLLYTMAVNHPVFTFQQRDELRRNFLSELDAMAKEHTKMRKSQSRTSLASNDSSKDEKTSNGGVVKRIRSSITSGKEGSLAVHLAQCEVKGVHKRSIDKRYVYLIEVKWSNNKVYMIRRTYGEFFSFQTELLNLFPEEAGDKKGHKNRKTRVIPYLPGKKLFSKESSKEIAEKRLPELAKYTRELMKLPHQITQSDHVLNFFIHHAQDLKEDGVPQKITTPDDIIPEGDSTEGIDYSVRSSSFHHSRGNQINVPSAKYRSLPNPAKEAGHTETLKSSQQNMFTASPLYVNIQDLTNSNSNSSLASSEGQEKGDYPDEDDDLLPLPEGYNRTSIVSARSNSIIAIDTPQSKPIATLQETNEIEQDGQVDGQVDDILNFCADEIASGTAGSVSSTPFSTPTISPSHTPTLPRTPTPQGHSTSHMGPIHPVAMPRNSGNATHFIYQSSSVGAHPFVNASPLPSPHIKRFGSCTSVPRDPYEFESLSTWLKDLRLHKYRDIFSHLTFDEMCKMKGEEMVNKGMTKGATKKLLRKLANLKISGFTGFPGMPGSGRMQRRSSTCSLPAALYLTDQPCPSPTLADHHGSSVKRSISGYNLAGRGSRPNSECLDDPLFADHAILHAGPFLQTETPPPDNMSVHSDTEIPPVQDANIPLQSRFQRKGAVRVRHSMEDSNIIAEQANHISAEDLIHLQQQQLLHKSWMAAPPMAAIVPHMTPPMHFNSHPHPQNPNWATHIIPVSRPAIIPHNIQYQIRHQPGQPLPQFATGINGLPAGGMIRPFPPQQMPFVPNHIQPPGPAAGFPNQFPPRGNGNSVMCCNCGSPGHNSAQCCHTTPDSQSKSFHRSLRQSFSNPPNLNANNSKLL